MSENPFDDWYHAAIESTFTLPALYEDLDSEMPESSDIVAASLVKILSPSSVSSSDTSCPSTTPSTPPSPYACIEWTDADLNYLLNVLYPDPMLADELVITPPLESLQSAIGPIQLQLYLRVPPQAIPDAAYAATAPIGTGRPISKLLVKESAPCKTAAQVRQSLAEALLNVGDIIDWIVEYYRIVSALYRLSVDALGSVRRGIAAMGKASQEERRGRHTQLRAATVDESWAFEARLELFLLDSLDECCDFDVKLGSPLLGSGCGELGRWERAVGVAELLNQGERAVWAGVYGEAGGFLEDAKNSCWGDAPKRM